jgi:hypothetical protein
LRHLNILSFVVYLTTMSLVQTIGRQILGRSIKYAVDRYRVLFRDSISEFSRRKWRKSPRTSARIVDVPTEILTNTSRLRIRKATDWGNLLDKDRMSGTLPPLTYHGDWVKRQFCLSFHNVITSSALYSEGPDFDSKREASVFWTFSGCSSEFLGSCYRSTVKYVTVNSKFLKGSIIL